MLTLDTSKATALLVLAALGLLVGLRKSLGSVNVTLGG